MPAVGRHVYQLPDKVGILAEAMKLLERTRRGDRKSLAELVGAKPQTLTTACIALRITKDLEDLLAAGCNIDLGVPQWYDDRISDTFRARGGDRYAGRDTAFAFRAYAFQHFGLPVFSNVLIKPKVSENLDDNLAVVTVTDHGQSTPAQSPMLVFLEVDVSPSQHPDGFYFGFKKARIRLSVDEDIAVPREHRLGQSGIAAIGGAQITLRGTDHHYFWELTVNRNILDGQYSTGDHALCQLLGVQADMELFVEMSVQLNEAYLGRLDGEPLKDGYLKGVIAALMAKRLGGVVDSNGWLVLARQRLRIVLADSK